MNNTDKLDFIKKYAKLLDSQFEIPGTKWTFGIDPLLSLVPVLGSFSGFITGSVMILLAHQQGVSGKTKILMFKNLVIDFILGVVPIVGNISDFIFKSNVKNMLLIEEHLMENKHQGSGKGILLILILFAFGLLVVSLWMFFVLAKWFVGLLGV